MKTENLEKCFGDKGFERCTVLTTKKCEKCKFKMSQEDYINKRLQYSEHEISYLDKNGISTADIKRFIKKYTAPTEKVKC